MECFPTELIYLDAPECYGNLLNPLCSTSSNGLPYCHPCNPNRQTDWECVPSRLCALFFSIHLTETRFRCDCPPNYYCRPWQDRPDDTFLDGTCVPFDESTQKCFSDADCDVWTFGLYAPLTTVRLWRFTCLGGYCRPCNPANVTYWNGTKLCTAWDHVTQTGSSRPGETRTCGSDGYLVGGGVLATTLPPPTTAPPPSATTTTTTTTGGATHATASTGSAAAAAADARALAPVLVCGTLLVGQLLAALMQACM